MKDEISSSNGFCTILRPSLNSISFQGTGTIHLTGFLLESPEKNDEMNDSAFEEAGCKKVDPAVKKTSVLSKFGIVAKNQIVKAEIVELFYHCAIYLRHELNPVLQSSIKYQIPLSLDWRYFIFWSFHLVELSLSILFGYS